MSRVSKGMSVDELHVEAVYRSPTNRLCRWQPGEKGDSVVHFVYCSANGVANSTHNPDGFTLTRANLRLMRRVG